MSKARPLFNRTAADLMARLPNGRSVTVEGGGHLIPQENPVAVRDAILEVVAAAAAVNPLDLRIDKEP
jgi:pimeloyl-ACP methyl ester carboxylesterase